MSDNPIDPGRGRADAAGDAGTARGRVEELRTLVRQGNRRWRLLTILETAGLAAAVPMAYLWVVFGIDSAVHLPIWGRTAAAVLFVSAIYWMVRRLARAWREASFTEDQVALAIERRSPDRLDNRLINSLQIARGEGADGLGDAVVEENYRHLHQLRLRQAARVQPALVRIGVAAVLAVIGLTFWAVQRERFTTAAARIFLPFADVAPVYRTTLVIDPGNIEIKPGDDVVLRVRIEGRVPASLTVLKNTADERSSVELRVPARTNRVTYTFRAVSQTISYAVRGGDFVSSFYRIQVPAQAELKLLTARFRYPDYTHLPERRQEGPGGDLEAVRGTRAAVTFTFTQPVREAALLLSGEGGRRIPLKSTAAGFTGEIAFESADGYQLETRAEGRPARLSRRYDLRVVADLAPDLQLAGLDQQTEVAVDSVVPLAVIAKDDYGIRDVGLFYRPRPTGAAASDEEATNAGWTAVREWAGGGGAGLETNCVLTIAALGAAEGESIELALRARDTDPLKGAAWTTGRRYALSIGGTGSELQRRYEAILASESGLTALIAGEDRAIEAASAWMRKLDPSSGLRWDDRGVQADLAGAMKQQSAAQAALRESAAAIARNMPGESGSLRVSVGMLADTEMVRGVRTLEQVAGRDAVDAKRGALAEARLTQERVRRSLVEIRDRFSLFRREWELANMVPFTKMLADRQERMKGESLTYAGLSGGVDSRLPAAMGRRQSKVLELAGLAQAAYRGLGQTTGDVPPIVVDAFAGAAERVESSGMKSDMRTAAGRLAESRWQEAATNQQRAAAALAAIHAELVRAQVEAGRRALADLQDLGKSSVEAQKEIEKLRPGSAENLVDASLEKMETAEIVHLQRTADALKRRGEGVAPDGVFPGYEFGDWVRSQLDAGRPPSADFSIMKLAKKPGGQMSFPGSSDQEGNALKAKLLPDETYEDLVGDLLEEADDLREKYDTYNVNKTGQMVEPGEVGKQAGDLNSLSAAAATGNQKQPTHDFGGVSRSGRQGARAHGMVAGEESVNRRGRDEAQQGQEEVPDQPGEIKSTQSDDPQKDASTGVGGKLVKGEEPNSFSTKDEGEWKDEMAKRMQAPQKVNKMVDHKGKPLSPEIAEQLYDLNSTQEQVLERVKSIKKQLDRLFLPTDHLDEVMRQLTENLDRLNENPDADVYRLQMETLDKLKSIVVVFNRPPDGFQPSLAREQAVKGEILDEPARQTLPGYEDAVKRYYERLARP